MIMLRDVYDKGFGCVCLGAEIRSSACWKRTNHFFSVWVLFQIFASVRFTFLAGLETEIICLVVWLQIMILAENFSSKAVRFGSEIWAWKTSLAFSFSPHEAEIEANCIFFSFACLSCFTLFELSMAASCSVFPCLDEFDAVLFKAKALMSTWDYMLKGGYLVIYFD